MSQLSVAVICSSCSRCIQESGKADESLSHIHCSQCAAVCVPALAPKWVMNRPILISRSWKQRRCFPEWYYLGKADFWVGSSSLYFHTLFDFSPELLYLCQTLGSLVTQGWLSVTSLPAACRTFRTGGRSRISSDVAGRWAGLSVALAQLCVLCTGLTWIRPGLKTWPC